MNIETEFDICDIVRQVGTTERGGSKETRFGRAGEVFEVKLFEYNREPYYSVHGYDGYIPQSMLELVYRPDKEFHNKYITVVKSCR